MGNSQLGEHRMNHPQKFNQIYRELRMMLGDEIPAQELFSSAAKLVEIVEEDDPATGPRFYYPRATLKIGDFRR